MKRTDFFAPVLTVLLTLSAVLANTPATWAQAKLPKDVLLPAGKNMQGMFTVNDSKGGIWGINLNHGFIQQSTNNVYSNGLYLYVQGNNFYVPNNRGTLNKAGDEVQVGPWNHQGIVVYRRIRVFKKDGVARWLDIYHNPGPKKRINIRLRTHMNYGIGSLRTSSGKGTFTDKDFAFITTGAHGNAPATLHVVCGPKSKLRPRVQQRRGNNRYEVHYDLDLPAGGTAILVSFEAQDRSVANLRKMMKGFKPRKYLRDLPSKVRKRIANARPGGGLDDLELDREDHADRVVLQDGQELLGTIETTSFRLATRFGEITLPAERVVGMVAWGTDPGRLRALLTDGQIITGTLGDQTLRLTIPAVGVQTIPFADIRNWSYRLSKQRPDELRFRGPYLHLRTGDRLSFAPESVRFQLQTRDGVVDLDGPALQEIRLDNPKHGLHRAVFRNESELAGLLLPKAIEPKLQLGQKQTIPRNLLLAVEYATETDENQPLSQLVLANGDVLRGQLDEKTLTLKGKYGMMTLQPNNIRTLRSIPNRTGWMEVKLWNGSTVQGRLEAKTLRFQLLPGPTVNVATARITSFDQPTALPPANIIRDVTDLVVQLGAESYKDRKDAQDKLLKIGPAVVPILKKHLKNKDPEIRQRIKDILEQLGAVG